MACSTAAPIRIALCAVPGLGNHSPAVCQLLQAINHVFSQGDDMLHRWHLAVFGWFDTSFCLPWCCSAGGCDGSSESNPVLRKTTLARLQSAGQQLLLAGRATTGPKAFRGAAGTSPGVGLSGVFAGQDVLAAADSSDSSRRFGDSAAVAALKGLALLDPAAPLRCPAALLMNVAGKHAAHCLPVNCSWARYVLVSSLCFLLWHHSGQSVAEAWLSINVAGLGQLNFRLSCFTWHMSTVEGTQQAEGATSIAQAFSAWCAMSAAAGQCQEARQLQQQVEALQATSMQLAATINDAVAQEEQLQEKVG